MSTEIELQNRSHSPRTLCQKASNVCRELTLLSAEVGLIRVLEAEKGREKPDR